MTPAPAPRGDAALAGAVDALRSGAGPEEAWQRIGVLVRDGVPTLASLRDATGDPGLAAAAHAAARLAHELGAPAATVLDEVLRTAEDEADAAVRRDTALAGPAASARVLGWLPAFGLVVGLVLGADPAAVLLDPDGGWVLLAGGVGVAAAGHRWTAHLVRGAVRAARPTGTAPAPRAGRSGRISTGAPRGRLRALARADTGHLTGSGPSAAGATAPVPLVLDLLAAASESGASVPRSLAAVGAAVAGDRGRELAEAGAELGWGAGWTEAWSGRDPGLAPVARALRPAWEDGASPVAGARAGARAIRRVEHAAALAVAERLGVRLLLPLALCHLPAFVLLGIVPVLVSLVATGAGA